MTNAVIRFRPLALYRAGDILRPIMRALALVLSLFAAAPEARAEVRAVLVGVGDYLTLDADLKGPSNDVRLVAETLVLRGVDPALMTVLTAEPAGLPDGVIIGQPKREAILAAMQAVAKVSQSGDTLVFYFSGHGAQAPDMSGDEGGGYDEILLPADAAGWKGAIGAVENAILDDELQAWAQGALSRGVKVVGLIDACHSATGFRAVGGQGVARVVDEALLGIPKDVVPASGNPLPPLSGEFVFLYSSQSDQRSFEFPMPDGTWHGEFTLRLAQTLREAPAASWAQVLAATTEAMAQGPARQMPEGEGPMLGTQVFGQGAGMARFPVQGGTLAAGLLQGLTEGAEVALYAKAAGGEAISVHRLQKVTAGEAVLEGKVPPDVTYWAELLSAPPPAPLALAAPVRAEAGDGFDYAPWLAALPPGGPDADLVPILTEGTVALAGADGVLDRDGPRTSLRIDMLAGETQAEAVERVLAQAAHGLRLREVLAGAAGRSLTGKTPVTMTIDRRATDGTCDKVTKATPFDPANGVAPCDQLWLTLTNTGGKAQDVSVLYFAADFEVQPIWPAQNLANRLAPGESARVGLQIEETSAAGLEEIWVLAVPADPDAPRVDLTRLATPGQTRDFTGPPDPMSLWLEGRMDPETANRGFTLKPAALTMLRQLVRLQPRGTTPDMEN